MSHKMIHIPIRIVTLKVSHSSADDLAKHLQLRERAVIFDLSSSNSLKLHSYLNLHKLTLTHDTNFCLEYHPVTGSHSSNSSSQLFLPHLNLGQDVALSLFSCHDHPMLWHRHQWNPLHVTEQTEVPTDFSSCASSAQLSRSVKLCISTWAWLEVRDWIVPYNHIDFCRVGHSHIRLTSRVLSIDSSSIFDDSCQSDTEDISVRDSPPDLKTAGGPFVVFKVHPATLLMSLKVCAVSLVLRTFEWSEMLSRVLSMGADFCFHPSGVRGVNHGVINGIVRSEVFLRWTFLCSIFVVLLDCLSDCLYEYQRTVAQILVPSWGLVGLSPVDLSISIYGLGIFLTTLTFHTRQYLWSLLSSSFDLGRIPWCQSMSFHLSSLLETYVSSNSMEFWYRESTMQLKEHRLSSVSHANWTRTSVRLDQQIPSRLRRSDIWHDVTPTSTTFLQLHKKFPDHEIHVQSGDTTLSSLACTRDIFIIMKLFQWKVKIMRYDLLVRVRSVTSRSSRRRLADVRSCYKRSISWSSLVDVRRNSSSFDFSDIDACHCIPLLGNPVRHVNRIGDCSLVSPTLTVSLPRQSPLE